MSANEKCRWIRKGIMTCKLRVDAKGGIMMCTLKGWIDKGGHYDVQMKIWIQKGHYDVQMKRVDG